MHSTIQAFESPAVNVDDVVMPPMNLLPSLAGREDEVERLVRSSLRGESVNIQSEELQIAVAMLVSQITLSTNIRPTIDEV